MTMKPTTKQIDAEVEKLKEMRSKIPPRNFFGENNLLKIDAEIEALEKRMDEQQVYDRFGADETADEFQESDLEPQHSAIYAIQWMNGEEKESPSDGWKPLIK